LRAKGFTKILGKLYKKKAGIGENSPVDILIVCLINKNIKIKSYLLDNVQTLSLNLIWFG